MSRQSAPPVRSAAITAAAAFLFAAFVATTGLGSYGLVEPSDARYAEIGYEMWSSGDYLLPRLHGILHLHKPPLTYWLIAGGYRLFGHSERGARACLAAMALLLCVMVWTFARRHLPRGTAPWAVILLSTTPAVVAAGRFLTADLLLVLCQTAMLLSWYEVHEGRGGRGALGVMYAAAGLAFLAKGPVAWLVPVGILVPFVLIEKRGGKGRPRTDWGLRWGIPLSAFIAFPWYLYVVARIPGLLSYFIGDQLLSRLSSGGMGHPKPWWFFVPLFPALGFPWILFLREGRRQVGLSSPSTALFLTLWAAVPPILFSLPRTKLPLYPLLSYPSMALLASSSLSRGSAPLRLPLRLAGAIFAFLAALMALTSAGVFEGVAGDPLLQGAVSLHRLLLPAALIAATGGAASFLLARSRPQSATLALAGSIALLVGWCFSRGEALPVKSARTVATAARGTMGTGDLLVEYRTFTAGIPFYSGRTPLLAWIKREEQYAGPEARSRLVGRGEFMDLWKGSRRVLAVTKAKHLVDLPGAATLAAGGGYVLADNGRASGSDIRPQVLQTGAVAPGGPFSGSLKTGE